MGNLMLFFCFLFLSFLVHVQVWAQSCSSIYCLSCPAGSCVRCGNSTFLSRGDCVLVCPTGTVPFNNSGSTTDRACLESRFEDPLSNITAIKGSFSTTASLSSNLCGMNASAIVLNPSSLDLTMVVDINVQPGFIVQFSGVSGSCIGSAGTYYLNVEYSINSGASWSALAAPCNPSGSSSTCTSWDSLLTGSSVRYDLLPSAWERLIYRFPSSVSGRLRIRIRLSSGSGTYYFALNQLYIGNDCPDGCLGRGYCSSSGCVCDSGFSNNGTTCVPTTPAPTLLRDDFDDDLNPLWGRNVGSVVVQGGACGTIGGYRSLLFNGASYRVLETKTLDLSNARFVQFKITVGDGNYESSCTSSVCCESSLPTNGITVAYTINGGLSYTTLATVLSAGRNFMSVPLPISAQTPGTRIAFFQPPATFSQYYSAWALDDIYIGGSVTPPASLYLAFASSILDPNLVASRPNSVVESYCSVNSLHFSSSSGMQEISTTSLLLPSSSTVSFRLSTGCGSSPSSTFSIVLERSLNDGASWSQLVTQCNTISSCTSWGFPGGSYFNSPDFVNGWTRISFPVPDSTSPQRFRWRVTSSSISSSTDWAISSVYIGGGCPTSCDGHGLCVNGTCSCDAGFTLSGNTCVISSALKLELREDFEDEGPNSVQFSQYIGGASVAGGGVCGVLSANRAYLFNSATSRRLVTVDLNTTNAQVLQFVMRIGDGVYESSCTSTVCCEPSLPTDGVVLSYSNDGGVSWTLINRYTSSTYNSPTFTPVSIPQQAKTAATRFMWWQPSNPSTYRSAWSLDDIYIGYPTTVVRELQESFAPISSNWIFYPNGYVSATSQCGSQDFLYFPKQSSAQPSVSAGTRDFNLKVDDIVLLNNALGSNDSTGIAATGYEIAAKCGFSSPAFVFDSSDGVTTRVLTTDYFDTRTYAYVLSFSLAVGSSGCDTVDPGPTRDENVHFQYSVNTSSDSWTDIATFTNQGLGSFSYKLSDYPATIGPAVRFRWLQPIYTAGSDNSDVWALGNVKLSAVSPAAGFLQFSLNLGCTSSYPSSFTVGLQQSTDAGASWSYVVSSCNPITSCSTWNTFLGTAFESGMYPLGWNRFTVPISLLPNMRFRWILVSSGQGSWGIDDIYIGYHCPKGCSGHGKCTTSGCVCDTNFILDSSGSCAPSFNSLECIQETFSESSLNSSIWRMVAGGALNSDSSEAGCGITNDGQKILFNGGSNRRLETVDLNLTSATFIQFVIQIGNGVYESSCTTSVCCEPSLPSEGVVLVYSIDGGLTYQVVSDANARLTSSAYNSATQVVVSVSSEMKTAATRLAWWQPSFTGTNYDEWTIDDVYVGPGSWATPTVVREAFSSSPLDRTRFVVNSNGVVGSYCSKNQTIKFDSTYGIQELSTTPLNLGSSSIIQFELNTGCSSASSAFIIYLEYSDNLGKSWTTLTTACNPLATTCSAPMTWVGGTAFYSLDYVGTWTRVSLLLPSVQNGRRYRWRTSGAASRTWALANVYIGNECPDACGGFGSCMTGSCVCDPGYNLVNQTCVGGDTLRSELYETFNSGSLSMSVWSPRVSGGSIVSSGVCGASADSQVYQFSGSPTRRLETLPFNTINATYMQFNLRLGDGVYESSCSSSVCCEPSLPSEGAVMMYSTNGGITYNFIPSYGQFGSSTYNSPTRVVVPLPASARTPHTQFLWWQPSDTGANYDAWTLDDLYIGPAQATRPSVLDERFTSSALDTNNFVSNPNGAISTFCTRPAFVFSGNSGYQELSTNTLDLGNNSIIQFDLATGCPGDSLPSFTIYLEYSTNLGLSWNLVENKCDPVSSCTSWGYPGGTSFNSYDYGNGFETITLQLGQMPSGTRFRWRATISGSQKWALGNIYIGAGCPSGCNGHGYCIQGMCQCRVGFSGSDCSIASANLKGFAEDFENDALRDTTRWFNATGGALVGTSSVCGVLAAGNSVLFRTSSTRKLVTADLDVTNSTFLSFFIRIGDGVYESSCSSSICCEPSFPSDGVVVAYSVNGGMSWKLFSSGSTVLSRIASSTFNSVQEVVYDLPSDAKTTSTRFMWWQATNSGGNYDTWSIDDVYVGPSVSTRPSRVFANFTEGAPNVNDIFFYPNAVFEDHCDSKPSVHFTGSLGQQFLYTTNLNLLSNSFVQFELSTGCSGSASSTFSISLQYSDNNGNSWNSLLSFCNPLTSCTSFTALGGAYSSLDFASGWTRVTVLLGSGTYSGRRLRWISSNVGSNRDWALTNIYIGNECPGACSGHGSCINGTCVCDSGFALQGNDCVNSANRLTGMLLTFGNDDIRDTTKVSLVQGGAPASSVCGVMRVGKSLFFNGGNTRRIVTADIDTTNAYYVQFYLKLGDGVYESSCSSSVCCEVTSGEGIILAYSTNGGISWDLLGTSGNSNSRFDGSSYTASTSITVDIPAAARTRATRFMWWQPSQSGVNYDVWNLDDVLVGPIGNGSYQVQFQDNFDDIVESNWLTYVNAAPQPFCKSTGNALYSGTDTTAAATVDVVTRDLKLTIDEIIVLNDPLNSVANTSLWSSAKGYDITTGCGMTTTGYYFLGNNTRELVTVSLDTTPDRMTVYFEIGVGSSSCDGPDSLGESVLFQYSIDKGNSWATIASWVSLSYQSLAYSLNSYTAAKTNATMFRWIQPSFTSNIANSDVWTLRNVKISAIPQPTVYVQYSINMASPGCTLSSSNTVVGLDYSTNAGRSWTQVVPVSSSCPFGSCSLPWQTPSAFPPFNPVAWRRVTHALAGSAVSSATRFRWSKRSSVTIDYALDNIYIGASCPSGCNNHGACQSNGLCVCDSGFTGSDCSNASGLPTFMANTFDSGFDPAAIYYTNGVISSGCGKVSAVYNLQLGVGSFFETTDMDLRNAANMTFNYWSCILNYYNLMTLSYSVDGGMNWKFLKSYNSYSQTTMLSEGFALDNSQKVNGIRYRFDIATSNALFGIDNFRVGGACVGVTCSATNSICVDLASGYDCRCAPGYLGSALNNTCTVDKCSGVQCTALDSCHTAGVCVAGTCTNPFAANGTICDDGNSTTLGDKCVSGVCIGSSRCAGVVCSSPSPCYNSGTCDINTGNCTYAMLADNTTCSLGNSSTAVCFQGQCQVVNLCLGVTCSPLDQCHVAGVCNVSSGLCSNPPKPNATPCNDNNDTTVDSCQAGQCVGVSKCQNVTCTPSNSCRTASCVPNLGLCSEIYVVDGTPCDDQKGSTANDKCLAGLCVGTDLCANVTCQPLDQCHTVGTCGSGGICSNPVKVDGAQCDDGKNTTYDSCQAGMCVGVSKCADVTCFPADQCHVAGSCVPTTGQCTNPLAANGTMCDDNDSTTRNDTCSAGACAGVKKCLNVVCPQLTAQCFTSSVCVPQTGQCLNQTAASGTPCDDGDSTTTDSCDGNGVCVGVSKCDSVTCTALDECHDIGSCEPTTGVCYNPPKINGSSCSLGMCFGGVCTNASQSEVCKTVVCTAPSSCQDAVCLANGTCSYPLKTQGSACNDADNTTRNDVCNAAGVCKGVQKCLGVSCPTSSCTLSAMCEPTTGSCVYQTKANGSSCDDGNPNTFGDICLGSTCVGTQDLCSTIDCPQGGSCTNYDKCFQSQCLYTNKPDNTNCSSPSTGVNVGICENGTCVGVNKCVNVTCTVADVQCQVSSSCNPLTGACVPVNQPNNTPCNDSNPLTLGDVCVSGVCKGVDPCTGVSCSTPSQCQVAPGTCSLGTCAYPSKADNTSCDDGNGGTANDVCVSGVCKGRDLCLGVACQAGPCQVNPTCIAGSCFTASAADGSTCDDGNPLTTNDSCKSGVCSGSVELCKGVSCPNTACLKQGSCNPNTGECVYQTTLSAVPCDDGNANTTNDQCIAGICTGVNLCLFVNCNDPCRASGTCNPQTGQCVYATKLTGTPCDDNDPSTAQSICMQGVCVQNRCFGVLCPDTQCATNGTCNPLEGECLYSHAKNGASCDDHDPNTVNDVCSFGECHGTTPGTPKSDKSSSSSAFSTSIIIIIVVAIVILLLALIFAVVYVKSRKNNAVHQDRNPSMSVFTNPTYAEVQNNNTPFMGNPSIGLYDQASPAPMYLAPRQSSNPLYDSAQGGYMDIATNDQDA